MSSFQPQTGVTVYSDDSRPLILDQKVGKGGEGSVWSIISNPSVVAKFYHKGLAPDQARKLDAMCRLQSDNLLRIAAWPTAMLKASPSGMAQGIIDAARQRISGSAPALHAQKQAHEFS